MHSNDRMGGYFMEAITKKRLKATLIDACISSAVSLSVEYFLRKKVKSEFVHTVVSPTAIQYSLEFAQLRASGKTVGYRVMGLELKDEDGKELTSNQLLKRFAYRDTVSTFKYFSDKKAFEGAEGRILPHDRHAGTIVREK